MSVARGTDRKLVGAALALLGILALVEARRLYALRTTLVAGAVVGDDTFPLIVGTALVTVGAYLLAVAHLPAPRVHLAQGPIRVRLLAGAAVLVAYCAILPWLGYSASTALGSTALYLTLGGYRWPVALLLGAITTGALHLLFRVWLLQPLPTGWLGF